MQAPEAHRGHTGIELIRAANQHGCTAALILYTGRGSYEVDIEAMQAGATFRYDYISPSCEQVVGYTAEELMAQDATAAFEMIHPDEREMVCTGMAPLELTNTAEIEYRQRTKAGEYRWMSNSVIKKYPR